MFLEDNQWTFTCIDQVHPLPYLDAKLNYYSCYVLFLGITTGSILLWRELRDLISVISKLKCLSFCAAPPY